MCSRRTLMRVSSFSHSHWIGGVVSSRGSSWVIRSSKTIRSSFVDYEETVSSWIHPQSDRKITARDNP